MRLRTDGARVALAALALLLAGCGAVSDSARAPKADASTLPPADDNPEPGLQGQVPLDAQLPRLGGVSGTIPVDSYRRGARLLDSLAILGEVNTGLDRGGNYELAWLDDCAYVGMGDLARQALNDVVLQGPGPDLPDENVPAGAAPGAIEPGAGASCGEEILCGGFNALPELPGVGLAVISAKNPADLKPVYIIQIPLTPHTPGIDNPVPKVPDRARTSAAPSNPWEALDTNAARRLIMVASNSELATYQAVYNCKYPSRRSITSLGSFMAHGLRIAPDGMTAWVSDANADGVAGAPVLAALDLTNPRQIATLATFADPALGRAGIHGIDLSADGTRAYVTYAAAPQPGTGLLGVFAGGTGLLVLDIADVQARREGAAVRVLGRLEWEGGAHAIRRARIAGRDHLLVTDTVPFLGACPWGWGRIIDIGDETQPVEVAQVALQVNDPAHCNSVTPDAAIYTAQSVSVDDPDDTQLAFFGWHASGLRIFDLSEPAAPVEVGYYNPPPNPDTVHRSAQNPTGGFTLDAVVSRARYRPETGELWFVSVAGGLHTVELTRSLGPAP